MRAPLRYLSFPSSDSNISLALETFDWPLVSVQLIHVSLIESPCLRVSANVNATTEQQSEDDVGSGSQDERRMM